MAIYNIIYDFGNEQCCFHCESGKADKKQLKCVNNEIALKKPALVAT